MKTFVAIFLSAGIFGVSSVSFKDVVLEEWETFKLQHGKLKFPTVLQKLMSLRPHPFREGLLRATGGKDQTEGLHGKHEDYLCPQQGVLCWEAHLLHGE